MQKFELPISMRQVVKLALLLCAPLILSMAVVLLAWPKQGQAHGGLAVPVGLIVVTVIGLLGIVVAMMGRRVVGISPSTLHVKHSLYTLAIDKSSVTTISVCEVQSLADLGLAKKTNGIAAFGYRSGWFRRKQGDSIFCAVSTGPMYLIALGGHGKYRHLALSANVELIRRIEMWGAT